jgi:hypothetical protein
MNNSNFIRKPVTQYSDYYNADSTRSQYEAIKKKYEAMEKNICISIYFENLVTHCFTLDTSEAVILKTSGLRTPQNTIPNTDKRQEKSPFPSKRK